MIEEVYEYLTNYGFIHDELKKFEKENEDLYFAGLKIIENNIKFLESKDIEKNEIMNIIRKNPFMLTCGSKKKEMIEEIYISIFTLEEIKKLIIRYPSLYTVNPSELKEVIDYINSKKINLKIFIKDNVKVLSFDGNEIREFMK